MAATAAEAATTSAPEPGGGRSERAAAALSEALYGEHHRLVLGLCRGLLRDPAEAEDAAQQVFLSAHRSLLNGAEPREPAAWLATIARNECWSRISARMREPLPTDDADLVESGRDPLAEAIRSTDLEALWRAIRALPRSQRDALLLREFGGLRYDELAVALAVTEPAVESLLVRARSRLREQLRTAYASLAPALRFLVSSGTPAIAAKAAVLGVGTAAVTAGVAIAPPMLTRHHMQPPPAATTTVAAVTTRPHPKVVVAAVATPPPAAPAPAAPAPLRVATLQRPRHRPVQEREHEAEAATGTDDTTSIAIAPTTVPVTTTTAGSGSDGGSGSGSGSDSGSNDGSGDGATAGGDG